MVELIRTWWPVMVLAYVPTFASFLVQIFIGHAFGRLDRSHPDNMPLTAGDWLEREIARLGLTGIVHVIATDGGQSLGRYNPGTRTIQLGADAYFKRDPMYWAIAAHELGHARFRIAWPIASRLETTTRILCHVLVSAGLALALGNFLFPLGTIELAYLLLVAAAICRVPLLIDEWLASALAMRSLRTSEHMWAAQLRSARRCLGLAFSTYVIGFVTPALLLTQWHLVEGGVATTAPVAAQLTTLGLLGAGVATFVFAAYAVVHVVSVFVRGGYALNTAAWIPLHVAVVALLLLVWNHRADPAYARWVVLALVPVSGWITFVVSLPMLVIDTIVLSRFRRRWIVDGVDRTPELARDLAAGKALRERGQAALRAEGPWTPVELHVAALLRLTPGALVVAFWLS